MKKIISFIVRHRLGLTATGVAIIALAILAQRCLPSTANEMRASVVVVEQRSWYALCAKGQPTLFFAGIEADSTALQPSTDSLQAATLHRTDGCWMNRWPAVPSCHGRIVTVVDTLKTLPYTADDALLCLIKTLETTMKREKNAISELNYYLRVHGVQDEGYQQIAVLATQMKAQAARNAATLALADSLLKTATPLTLQPRTTYTAWYRPETDDEMVKNKPQKVLCQRVAVGNKNRLLLLQTLDKTTPDGVKTQYLLPWNTTNRRLIAAGHGAIGIDEMGQNDASVVLTMGRRTGQRHHFPSVLATDGTALFTPRGLFGGLVNGKNIVGRNAIQHLLMKGGEQ